MLPVVRASHNHRIMSRPLTSAMSVVFLELMGCYLKDFELCAGLLVFHIFYHEKVIWEEFAGTLIIQEYREFEVDEHKP